LLACWTAGLNTGSDDYPYANIALRQRAWQSSTLWNSPYTADKAVDGNKDTNLFNQHCTHTDMNNELHPWWAVDLGYPVFIYGVNLTNRADCCGEYPGIS
jgi:F5/8 type C domain